MSAWHPAPRAGRVTFPPGRGTMRAPMNFAEQLASWYLRLNGFLVLPNYVLHRLEEGQRDEARPLTSTSDTDLLAIRHPYVFEEIGGQPNSWDTVKLNRLLDPVVPMGLVVEVKGGGTSPSPRLHEVQLARGIRRLGHLPEPDVQAALAYLAPAPGRRVPRDPFLNGRGGVGTVLICQEQFAQSMRRRTAYTHVISLEHCRRFITRRFRSARRPGQAQDAPPPKVSDWHFFPDELIQFLAWDAGLQVEDDGVVRVEQ